MLFPASSICIPGTLVFRSIFAELYGLLPFLGFESSRSIRVIGMLGDSCVRRASKRDLQTSNIIKAHMIEELRRDVSDASIVVVVVSPSCNPLVLREMTCWFGVSSVSNRRQHNGL